MAVHTPAIRLDSTTEGAPSLPEDFSPYLMVEVEITRPIPTLTYSTGRERAWILVRIGTEPIGKLVVELGGKDLSADRLANVIWAEFHQPVIDRFVAADLAAPRILTAGGLPTLTESWPFLRRRRDALAMAPLISVVICTRNRPQYIEQCLRQVHSQEYPNFEIVVVDNTPGAESLKAHVASYQDAPTIHYVTEPRPGLSRARNAGVRASCGEIIAFIDDDEQPDRYWLAEIATGFSQDANIGCVSGMILPARLETLPQERFEEFGGHSKGRGFSASLFSKEGPQSPLFPRPPFGAGGNMAFRREALAKAGGFDVALGAGTAARSAEDTLAFTLLLLEGYFIAYRPAALVRHKHYESDDDLARQMRGYGVGLTAFYAALVRHRPTTIPALARLGTQAVSYLSGAQSDGSMSGYRLPKPLKRQHRIGLLTGAAAYARSAYAEVRASRRENR